MFKKAIIKRLSRGYEMINAQASVDCEFRKRLLKKPKRAIYEATGFVFPKDWDITFVDINGKIYIKINDDRWLKRFGLCKNDLVKALGNIIYNP